MTTPIDPNDPNVLDPFLDWDKINRFQDAMRATMERTSRKIWPGEEMSPDELVQVFIGLSSMTRSWAAVVGHAEGPMLQAACLSKLASILVDDMSKIPGVAHVQIVQPKPRMTEH